MNLQPAQAQFLHVLTLLAFAVHISAGTVGLVSGTIAISARKGGRLHRLAGNVFFVSMLIMASLAIYLAVVMPDQLPNVFIGLFAIYLISTAWITVRRKEGAIGLAEKIALAVAVILCAPFAILSFQLALGLPAMLKSAVPLEGPVLVAIFSFTAILAIAAISDFKVVLAHGIAGAPRIARHLWRMCLGLTLAAGSAFTNGLARLLPGAFHAVPLAFFLPQFVPVVILIFWMIRVRLTTWYARHAATAIAQT